MEVRVKLSILADAAKYDASCASSGAARKGKAGQLGHTTGSGICHSYTPDGRCVSLLKILLTNYCIYDCLYCVNRQSSDTPRARFTIEEVVTLTLEFYKRNYIEGLFLSSGVINSVDYTMEQLIAVAKSLRLEHGYNGYIHLKVVPGASEELTREAALYADRVSANVELPTEVDLAALAPQKTLEDVTQTMSQLRRGIEEYRAESTARKRNIPRFAPGGQSTQMIVGATLATDADVLGQATNLYSKQKLRRVYYSAFSPIPHSDARLPGKSPPLIREHRLYQADWLMRFYGFRADEITEEAEPNLSLEIDPKLSWALRNRHYFPLDLNKASRNQLLRVPGLGKRNVERILSSRRHSVLRISDLAKLRVSLPKVRPWVIAADHNREVFRLDRIDLRTRLTPTPQLSLFEAQVSSLSGEV